MDKNSSNAPNNGRLMPKDALTIPSGAKKVFSGKIFDVYQWDQAVSGGGTMTYEMARRADSVFIIPIIDDAIGCIAYKAPNMKIRKLSLPGGRMDPGEDALYAAKRELKEETGLVFKNWKCIDVFQPEEKIDWMISVFVASDIVSREDQELELGEDAVLRFESFEKLKTLVHTSKRLRALAKWDSIEAIIDAPDILGN